jgi:hypothetical protein
MTDSQNNDANDPAHIPALRWTANIICLWGLCGETACRRACACKRDPRACLPRYAPLVPYDVRDGAATLLAGLNAGIDDDRLRRQAHAQIKAVEDWRARIAQATRRDAVPAAR